MQPEKLVMMANQIAKSLAAQGEVCAVPPLHCRNRLATVLRADLIHVVDGGRVVESGTHDELLSANGAYARLYELQFMGEAEQQLGV